MEEENNRSVGEECKEGESVGKVSGSLAEKPAEVCEFLFLAHLLFGSCSLFHLALLVYSAERRKGKATSPKGMGVRQAEGLGTLLDSLAIKRKNSLMHFNIYSLNIYFSAIVLFNCVTNLRMVIELYIT